MLPTLALALTLPLLAKGFSLPVEHAPAELHARAGGFPRVNSPQGACGPLPADSSCAALFTACLSQTTASSDLFATETCVAAAICFPVSPDVFLYDAACRRNPSTSPTQLSAGSPPVPDPVYTKISGGSNNVTKSAFGSWYTTLALANGAPAPISQDFLTEMYQIISAWTRNCNTPEELRAINKQNFLDWVRYSSTVPTPEQTRGHGDVYCAVATPNPTPAGDCTAPPAQCQAVFNACMNDINALKDPWSLPICVAAATCFQAPLDTFINAVACAKSGYATPARYLPVVSRSFFDRYTQSSGFMTQQNWIDLYYNAVGTSVQPPVWPDVSLVASYFKEILRWTGRCNEKTVPYQNFADYFHWSSITNVPASACSDSACANDAEPACQILFDNCVSVANSNKIEVTRDPYAVQPACFLAATCRAGGIKGFASAVACATNNAGANDATKYVRLRQDIFAQIASDSGLTQQRYVDLFYSYLSQIQTTSYPAASYVIDRYQRMKSWVNTNEPLPYGNVADFLLYN